LQDALAATTRDQLRLLDVVDSDYLDSNQRFKILQVGSVGILCERAFREILFGSTNRRQSFLDLFVKSFLEIMVQQVFTVFDNTIFTGDSHSTQEYDNIKDAHLTAVSKIDTSGNFRYSGDLVLLSAKLRGFGKEIALLINNRKAAIEKKLPQVLKLIAIKEFGKASGEAQTQLWRSLAGLGLKDTTFASLLAELKKHKSGHSNKDKQLWDADNCAFIISRNKGKQRV
jgi:hypothetical protein